MKTVIYPWQKAPLTRLLAPFIAGILLQWYLQLPIILSITAAILSFISLTSFFFIDLYSRYKLSSLNGLITLLLFISLGSLLTYAKDIRHDQQWFGHSYKDSMALLVTVDEVPVVKARSFKAEAVIAGTKGKIIVYLQKDSISQQLDYGSRIIFNKPLQEIKNTGNPGAFDYKRYSLFHDITHQVYLKTGEYIIVNTKGGSAWIKFIYSIRERILTILRDHITGDKETGLAEALLIGYKNDLDKTLVQSYTNTGVVHVIAISGLHLGLIYWILVKLFQPLQKRKGWIWLRPLLIIAGLWIFSCLAGAQPSVVRSALMLTCIVAGETLTRKTNIYNTLALSAFLLLCYDPFWLWDIGFQLSYAAVVSLILFMRPIYSLLYFKNKLPDMIWQLNAITLAAQLLTLPVSIFYFHQFPAYFLLTNFIAVPLSSLILIAEIILCMISFIPFLATLTGKLITWLIWLMNTYIENTGSLPFPLWNGLQINIAQAVLLTIFILTISFWLINKSGLSLKAGLIALLGFVTLRSISFIETGRQQKIIVYNIPQKKAIDILQGHQYSYTGDSLDEFTENFHLRPSRIMHRASPAILYDTGNYIMSRDKRILLLDKTISFDTAARKQTIDLLILSKNPRIYIHKLVLALDIKQVVFDASVPAWKSRYWKKDCDSLHIPWHDVTIKGAFAMNLR
jgi:competence protein ComEC